MVDDYGHHPTEIRATLEALRTARAPAARVVLFQPHRYTRTQHLWDEFCRAFHQADVLLLTDVYAAGEEPIAGRDARRRWRRRSRRKRPPAACATRATCRAAIERLAAEAREGDVVLTLGAGSVWTAGEELLRRRGAVSPRTGDPRLGSERRQADRRQRRLKLVPADLPLIESDEPPFLRPERRTRVRRARRGLLGRG